ncbi:iron uptake transporter permease EfeU [Luteimicrobium sp. NPDC057192]|uniref:iron uptake transporter permease EfeU n=1 Tax=Luteimicrobium sp. NPDC057192 TaxID=3346042 RepID=UPI003643BB94
MLATFVIGLREGLEAALIVGILAAFLKRNGASLRPLWIGIGAAVVLSVAVGVTLEVVSSSLPQQAQEGMETVISAVAILFVTTMIVWMSKHARGLKKELEAHAGEALREGTAWALAGMAFLAIVKEGFETSVFLLATFQASTSTAAAVVGAALGIVVAVGLGIGLYHGGVRLNLGKFFQYTGIFLVFVAAGLVLTMLRHAHEAGWITIGQGRTVDLTWLAPVGSVRAALISGILGMPTDPRVIELLGWALYLVPMLALAVWPAKRRFQGRAALRLELALAGGLGVAAVLLAVLVPTVPAYRSTTPAPVVASADGSTPVGTAGLGGENRILGVLDTDGRIRSTVSFDGAPSAAVVVAGVDARESHVTTTLPTSDLPATVTLDDLLRYGGGKLPVGVSADLTPGPFDAAWSQTSETTAWTTSTDTLLDATQTTTTVLTLDGGGLSAPRTLTVAPGSLGGVADWTVAPSYRDAVVQRTTAADLAAQDRDLWRRYLPLVLAVAALALVAAALRRRSALVRAAAAADEPATLASPQAVPGAAAVGAQNS